MGLRENPSAFRKWMVIGPEQARLLKEFDEFISEKTNKHHHHNEEVFCTQMTFKKQALSLVVIISEKGNPFLDDSPELLILDTENVNREFVVSNAHW